jgi:dimethylhistidine N-methyltransferase
MTNGHRTGFGEEVKRDLALTPKQLQSKYLYNDLGSTLFEAICRLPWYRITRGETRLLRMYADSILSGWAEPTAIVELGSGSGEKLSLLLASSKARRQYTVQLVDISQAALDLSEQALDRLDEVEEIVSHRTTYEDGLRRAMSDRDEKGSMLVLLLGSNIGNSDPPAAHEFLREIHAVLRPGDGLLLGADLWKPEAELLRAYDDPLGVTAAFNKNVLVRINEELDADFDLDGFRHEAVWNESAARIEMHLVSRRPQQVRIDQADCTVTFEEGEFIWTESSYKYSAAKVVEMAAAAGFDRRSQWIDSDAKFALTTFDVG